MQTRYKEEIFSLIAIKVILKDNTHNFDLLLEFSKLIRHTFREIDFCSKLNNSSFLFLFPKTDLEKYVIIQKRIDEFLKSINVNRDKIEIKVEAFTSTQTNISEVTGRQLIQEITKKTMTKFLNEIQYFLTVYWNYDEFWRLWVMIFSGCNIYGNPALSINI